MSKAIKIKGKTEDDIKKQLIKHGFGNYNNSSIANGKKLKDMKMAPSIMQIFHDLKRQGKIMENSINEISNDERAMLSEAVFVKENSRLGCQIQINKELDGLVFEIAPE